MDDEDLREHLRTQIRDELIGVAMEARTRRLDALKEVEIGDYVLASKWYNGDPCDHFVVGFVSGFLFEELRAQGRHRVTVRDEEGKEFRRNGFRRAERITADEGAEMVRLMPFICDRPGPSVFEVLQGIRE